MENKGFFSIRRILAVVLGMFLFAAVAVSAFFITAEAHHDCKDDHCQVCECIRQCEAALKQMGSGVTVAVSAFVAAVFFAEVYAFSGCEAHKETLVSIKVRIND